MTNSQSNIMNSLSNTIDEPESNVPMWLNRSLSRKIVTVVIASMAAVGISRLVIASMINGSAWHAGSAIELETEFALPSPGHTTSRREKARDTYQRCPGACRIYSSRRYGNQ